MYNRRTLVAALTAALAASLIAVPSSAAPADPPGSPKRLAAPVRPSEKALFDQHTVLVRFKEGANTARVLKDRRAAQTGVVDGTGFVKVKTDGKAVDLLKDLAKDPAVAEVSLDYQREKAATPNDPEYSARQGYLNTIEMPRAWDKRRSATGHIVAVIDTGIDSTHPDLSGKVVSGYNAVSPGSSTQDNDGHGTMVAGVIAAKTHNSVGVAGVTWDGRVMPVKVFSGQYAQDSHIAAGITWATNHGAKVINLSLGGPGSSSVLHSAVKYAVGKGVVVVAAAGNSGNDIPQYPAAFPEVLAVGATDKAAGLTWFSSWGDHVDLAAPGWKITSTHSLYTPCGSGCQYGIADGTSLSAPIVAGVAALVRAQNPGFTVQQVMVRLKASARDAGPRGIDPYYGSGVLDAANALGGGFSRAFEQPDMSGWPDVTEPNDVPDRAVLQIGNFALAGDVDWYRFDIANSVPERWKVSLTPPPFDENRPQNVNLAFSIYDSERRLLHEVDAGAEGSAESITAVLATGRYYVKISNRNGSADARPYTFARTRVSSALFAAPEQLATDAPGHTKAVLVGDVTGDGREDVVVSGGHYNDGVTMPKLLVYPQLAGGELGAPIVYETHMTTSGKGGLSLLDANGDGLRDVALATSQGIELFFQGADSALEPGRLIDGSTGASTVVAADVDADGDDDLVVTRESLLQAFIQQPEGVFTAEAEPFGVSGAISDIRAGDINADGRIDIVTRKATTIVVHLRSEASWDLMSHKATESIEDVEVGEVTGDERADIIAGHESGLIILSLQQDGTLTKLARLGEWNTAIEVADWNADGKNDVFTYVTGTRGGIMVDFMRSVPGLGSHLFDATPPISGATSGSHMAVGKINGDDKLDIVFGGAGSIAVVYGGADIPAAGPQTTVNNVSPPDFAEVSISTVPSVTLASSVDPVTITAGSVRLVDGRTGGNVATTLSYDATSDRATLKPKLPFYDNHPYRIVVAGLKDTTGRPLGRFTSTFKTIDLVPPAARNVVSSGGYQSVRLSWSLPAITDFDRVVVRMASGNTAPSSPTSGTSVYSGTGTSVTKTGLTGKAYSFSIWVKDRSGKYSPVVTKKLKGTVMTTSGSSSVRKGYSVTVGATLKRQDTGGALSGQAVKVYGRKKGTSTWSYLRTRTTSSTGRVSYSHRPSASYEYQFRFNGSPSYIGSRVTKSVSVYS